MSESKPSKPKIEPKMEAIKRIYRGDIRTGARTSHAVEVITVGSWSQNKHRQKWKASSSSMEQGRDTPKSPERENTPDELPLTSKTEVASSVQESISHSLDSDKWTASLKRKNWRVSSRGKKDLHPSPERGNQKQSSIESEYAKIISTLAETDNTKTQSLTHKNEELFFESEKWKPLLPLIVKGKLTSSPTPDERESSGSVECEKINIQEAESDEHWPIPVPIQEVIIQTSSPYDPEDASLSPPYDEASKVSLPDEEDIPSPLESDTRTLSPHKEEIITSDKEYLTISTPPIDPEYWKFTSPPVRRFSSKHSPRSIANRKKPDNHKRSHNVDRVGQLEDALFNWYMDHKDEYGFISGPEIQKKALQLKSQFLKESDDFTADYAWLFQWRMRHGVPVVKYGTKYYAIGSSDDSNSKSDSKVDSDENPSPTREYWKPPSPTDDSAVTKNLSQHTPSDSKTLSVKSERNVSFKTESEEIEPDDNTSLDTKNTDKEIKTSLEVKGVQEKRIISHAEGLRALEIALVYVEQQNEAEVAILRRFRDAAATRLRFQTASKHRRH